MNVRAVSLATLGQIVAGAVLLTIAAVMEAEAGGEFKNWRKHGDGRTGHARRYEGDYYSDPGHVFGQFRTVRRYQDPDIEEARSLPSPLDNPHFDSYELIVVIVKDDGAAGREQTMRVYQRGQGLLHYWLISTGKPGFETRRGHFVPRSFSSRHWSSKYDAPMDWSVFFDGGRALHSSWDREGIEHLGRKFSHGCVHVPEYRARELFHLIGHSGYDWVDRIGRGGRRSGRRMKAHRTLIIVT